MRLLFVLLLFDWAPFDPEASLSHHAFYMLLCSLFACFSTDISVITEELSSCLWFPLCSFVFFQSISCWMQEETRLPDKHGMNSIEDWIIINTLGLPHSQIHTHTHTHTPTPTNTRAMWFNFLHQGFSNLFSCSCVAFYAIWCYTKLKCGALYCRLDSIIPFNCVFLILIICDYSVLCWGLT